MLLTSASVVGKVQFSKALCIQILELFLLGVYEKKFMKRQKLQKDKLFNRKD